MSARWRVRGEAPSHADDWLMTYADMITLLLCFFALFISVSLTHKDVRQGAETSVAIPLVAPPRLPASAERAALAPAADAAAEADAAPVATNSDTASVQEPPARATKAPAPKPEPTSAAHSGAPPEPKSQMPQQRADVGATLKPDLPQAETVAAPPPASSAPARPIPAPVENAAAASPPVTLDLPNPDLPSGDRISILEMSSAAFFDSGSATLTSEGATILLQLSAQLLSDQYRGYRITVEGHTDDNPIHTAQFPSNWELSTARAAAVVHFLLDQGVPAQRLSAAGYGDTFPKVPNRDAAGNPIPENQAQNRRVVIKLEKIAKAEPPTVTATFYPPADLQ